MAFIILWCCVLVSVTKVFQTVDARKPIVPGRISNIIDLSKLQGATFKAPCRSWMLIPTGTSVIFNSLRPRRNSAKPRKKKNNKSRSRRRCRWMFQATNEDDRIEINCQTFNVGQRRRGKCTGGKLQIRTGRLRRKGFCGQNGPQDFVSNGNWASAKAKIPRSKRRSNYEFKCKAKAIPTIPPIRPTATVSNMSAQETPCSCGLRGGPGGTRIIGGVEAALHELPWQVALVDKNYLSQIVCGAVLINDRYVLTAAHCLAFPYDPADLTVALGEHNLATTIETQETIYREIDAAIIHENFNYLTFENDIALVQLSGEVDLDASDAIKPICLPVRDQLYEGVSAIASGWGLTSVTGSPSDILQKVQLTIINNDVCSNTNPNRPVLDKMLCATDPGKDTCLGDRGGPLILENENHYEVVGIISYGIVCSNPLYPGVFTRVSKYVDWINAKVTDAKTCNKEDYYDEQINVWDSDGDVNDDDDSIEYDSYYYDYDS